jgi:peptidoglycan/LPS O-acetylase OafA/YrhL
MQDSGGKRLFALEGLRGVAALVVVIFHGLSMFYPIMLYGIGSGIQNSRFEDNLFGNPLSVALSGAFAVAIFFVLSGFVLTISYFKSGQPESIMRIAGKRYIRLMIPALSSIFLTLILVGFGLLWLKNEAAGISGSTWLANLWPQSVSFFEALSQGVWGVFFSNNTETSYNPVLWTMQYELLGSLLVFAVALLFGKAKHRWVMYALLLLATFKTWYIAFIIGMILADLYAHQKFPFQVTRARGWLILTTLVGLFLGGYPYTIPQGSIYGVFQMPWLTAEQNHSLYLSVAAALIIVGVIGLPLLSKFFGSKYVSLLGKYSFSIYLVHLAVLFVVGSGVFILLHSIIGFHFAALAAIVASLIVLAPLVYLFERYIDAPSIRLSSLFSNWLFDNENKKHPHQGNASTVETSSK